MRKKIVIMITTLAIVILAGVTVGIKLNGEEISNNVEAGVETTENSINNGVVVTEKTKEIVNETIESIKNGKDLSTTEEMDEMDENELETDALVEQENISYNGDTTGEGYSLLGSYQGLTYYSQADSRWANVVYTSTNNSSQTIKSSGCRSNCGCNYCIKFERYNITNYNGKFGS